MDHNSKYEQQQKSKDYFKNGTTGYESIGSMRNI